MLPNLSSICCSNRRRCDVTGLMSTNQAGQDFTEKCFFFSPKLLNILVPPDKRTGHALMSVTISLVALTDSARCPEELTNIKMLRPSWLFTLNPHIQYVLVLLCLFCDVGLNRTDGAFALQDLQGVVAGGDGLVAGGEGLFGHSARLFLFRLICILRIVCRL